MGPSNSSLEINFNNSGSTRYSYAANTYISPPVYSGNIAYWETSDGYLHSSGGISAALTGTNCISAPAVAYGMIYAGDCSYVHGYNPNGTLYWSAAVGYVTGISVANHVVYACASGKVYALDADYGSQLWVGGNCSSAPVVVNGTVYTVDAAAYAFTIPSLAPNAIRARRAPDPARLRPTLSLVAQATPELPDAAP